MLPIDPRVDPVVEILRLAYRRGLTILQEQSRTLQKASNQDGDEKPEDSGDSITLDSARPSQ